MASNTVYTRTKAKKRCENLQSLQITELNKQTKRRNKDKTFFRAISYTILYSTERALLGILLALLANQIVQTSEPEILPKAENDKQVIEQGSTLKLSCIEKVSTKSFEIKWTIENLLAKRS